MLVGAFVGALLIEAAKHLLGVYTTHALTLNKLYGSLGLIPLFMFWMYLMWMFVLFGLEVSSIIQTLRGRGIEVLVDGDEAAERLDASAVVRVVRTIADGFAEGRATSIDDLVQTHRLETGAVRRLVTRLEQAGLVARLEDPDRFVLARPAESIEMAQVLRVGFEAVGTPTESDPLTTRLRAAQEEAVRGLRLSDPLPA